MKRILLAAVSILTFLLLKAQEPTDGDYLYRLYSVAVDQIEAENYAEAEANALKGMEAAATLFGTESDDYADFTNLYTDILELTGRRYMATDIIYENLCRKERLLQPSDRRYLSKRYDIADKYNSIRRHDDAIRIATAIVGEVEAQNIRGAAYAFALERLAGYKKDNEDYADCIDLFTKALEQREGDKNTRYFLTIGSLSALYSTLGNPVKALEINTDGYEDLMALPEDGSTMKEEDKIRMQVYFLTLIAGNYNSLGNKIKAASLNLRLYELREKYYGETIPDEVRAELETESRGEEVVYDDESLPFIEALIEDYRVMLEEEGLADSPDYADYLCNAAVPFIMAKRYDKAEEKMKEGLALYKRIGYDRRQPYATSLEIMGNIRNCLGKNEEALADYKEALGILTERLHSEHPDILSLKTKIAFIQSRLGRPECVETAVEASNGIRNLLIATFSQLTAFERNLYWNKYNHWFQQTVPSMAAENQDPRLTENSLDNILLSKGLLLNTELELNRIISESGDNTLLNKYYRLCAIRSALNKQGGDDSSDVYSRLEETERLEKELMEASRTYGDYTANLNIRWQDVRDRLPARSMAVEFVRFDAAKDSTLYGAYVVRPGDASPVYRTLFSEKELRNIRSQRYYTSPELSRLIWQHLEPYMDGVDDIYFAPDGELYNIAVEALPHFREDCLLSERHNLYRLSSTRELARINTNGAIRNATLYGGLQYDTEAGFFEEDMKRHPEVYTPDFFGARPDVDEVVRGGVAPLPGTLEEVTFIHRALSDADIEGSLLTAMDGTESSFKALSGKGVNLMHIATHGFYLTQAEAANTKSAFSGIAVSDANANADVDYALTRSGLLFTGANHTLSGRPIPERAEDGILTAKEISTLDLRGLDMVVLSACQTGLGEISGDGVFGLQRGFKKAGANTLVMSLWPVSDKATQLLMNRFYANLTSGSGKYQALEEARRYVREYEENVGGNPINIFDNPKYWAAFVMLDGLQ